MATFLKESYGSCRSVRFILKSPVKKSLAVNRAEKARFRPRAAPLPRPGGGRFPETSESLPDSRSSRLIGYTSIRRALHLREHRRVVFKSEEESAGEARRARQTVFLYTRWRKHYLRKPRESAEVESRHALPPPLFVRKKVKKGRE